MARVHIASLERRRRMYAIRGTTGFEGYVTGSWQHAFQALIGPFGVALRVTTATVTIGFVSIVTGLVVRGISIGSAVAIGGAMTVGLWLVTSMVAFAREMRRVRRVPPPSLGPGQVGVREPRRPPPNAGTMPVELSEPIDGV